MSEIFLFVTLVAWVIGFLITAVGLLIAGAIVIANTRREPEDKKVFVPGVSFWIGVSLMVLVDIINIVAALV